MLLLLQSVFPPPNFVFFDTVAESGAALDSLTVSPSWSALMQEIGIAAESAIGMQANAASVQEAAFAFAVASSAGLIYSTYISLSRKYVLVAQNRQFIIG